MLLLEEDFNTHLYPELVSVIGRGNNTILDTAMKAAEAEAKGYLSRYDIAELFSQLANNRDPKLLLVLKDITVWHFITLGNPSTDLELRKTRYDDAIKWLREVQSGKVYYPDWPLPEPSVDANGQGDLFQVSSRPRRNTSY